MGPQLPLFPCQARIHCMRKFAYLFAFSGFCSLPLSLPFAQSQTVTPTSPQAVPYKVVLEVVNDPSAAGTSTYLVALSQQIQDRWIALLGPRASQHLPDAPEGEISVTINPDGHPSDLKVMHATHDKAFDKAAYRSLSEANFPPVPAGMSKPDVKLRVHFRVLRYPTQPAAR